MINQMSQIEGKAISIDTEFDKALEIKHLEDGMATLRWEIWEQFPVEKRNENMKAESEQMIAGRI